MADSYYRLVCFVVNICPEPLRAFFIQLAKKDAGSSYTSLDVYLTQRKQDIMQLQKKKIIRADQLSLVFPSHGTVNDSDWDVTLLVCLITNLFPGHIQPLENVAMKEIRNIRNNLQHVSNTANISNTDFSSHWGRLESAATALAHQVFNATEQISFKTKIDELKKNCLPNLVDCLRLWHEETVKDMANKIGDLQNEVNDLKSETRQTNSILHSVTVKKPGPAGDGDKNKRFKAVDNILKRLQANFEVTMRDLPKDFSAPPEALEIRTKLRDKHHVVVTGSYNSRYLETALAAIKEMGYNAKRCVVMQKSSDWRHIDQEDVDFVLCIDPFGRITLDESKAKGMADIFSSMKHTADDQEGRSIDIMIVTDITIFTECKLRHEHDLLEEEVKVFEATTEAQPADLTDVACENVPMINSPFSQELRTLRELTGNFLQRYRDSSLNVDNDFLKTARDKFKSKKAIVLAGTKYCQTAAAAVALASSYKPSQCLLLNKANDMMFIDWQNTCLVIIDEFAGKYRYEEKEVHKWYRMFDHLYSAVEKGTINIVITCERTKLKRCIDEISSHPLLEHVVELPDRVTNIKDEAKDQAEEIHQRQLEAPGSFISMHTRNTAGASGSTNFANSVAVRNAGGVIPGVSITGQLCHPIRSRNQLDRFSRACKHVEDFNERNLCITEKLLKQGYRYHKLRKTFCTLTAFRDPVTPWGHSEARASTSITKSSTSSFLWRITNKTSYSIKLQDDLEGCDIEGCCWLPSCEILLVDYSNKRLKKLDIDYTVVGVCQVSDYPKDVCYIGNNKAVVSSSFALHIVDVVNMRMTRSVDTDHLCVRVASHGNLLYVCGWSTIYEYDINNFNKRVLYTGHLDYIGQIAISDDGSKIYMTCLCELVTIDSSGNHLYALNVKGISFYRDVCVDDAGHVLVCNGSTNSIDQVSSDGRQILGDIGELPMSSTNTMCFDRRRSALVFCEEDENHVTVLDMNKIYI